MSFTFKQFHVDDSRCAMKIGTDGVLLGAWADVGNARRIFDAGSGSGLISLMLAQRSPNYAAITAVEVDPEAALDCRANFDASPWSSQLSLIVGDCLGVEGVFELIVSNPPFFNTTLKSPVPSRSVARHGGTLNYTSLIGYSATHLSNDGTLAMITEYGSHNDILFAAEMAGLKLRRFCRVRSREGREPFRALWQFARTDGPVERSELVIRAQDGSYTQEYISLTGDFYLNL